VIHGFLKCLMDDLTKHLWERITAEKGHLLHSVFKRGQYIYET
jgi:hypothetical protein